MMIGKIKSYSELLTFDLYEDRYSYLMIGGIVGVETFTKRLRHLSQGFYGSTEWKEIRSFIVARDCGYDLGVEGRHIYGPPVVHHINPVKPDDLLFRPALVMDPENLITVSRRTHKAIHYGMRINTVTPNVDRKPNDTKLW